MGRVETKMDKTAWSLLGLAIGISLLFSTFYQLITGRFSLTLSGLCHTVWRDLPSNQVVVGSSPISRSRKLITNSKALIDRGMLYVL